MTKVYTGTRFNLPALSVAGVGSVDADTLTFAWQFTDNTALLTPPSSTVILATGVADDAFYYASPDLLPGQTLELSSNTLSLVSDSTVPDTLDATDSGSVLDEISARDHYIEVMDSPVATIFNRTKDITYEYAPTGSWPSHDGQATNRWNWVIGQADAGDVIEVSPGGIQAIEADASNYHSNSIDSCGLAVLKPLVIQNISGRGRWRVWAEGTTFSSGRNGIGVFDRAGMYDTTRTDIVLQGFDITDQFGVSGCGVRLRSPASVVGSWDADHASMTLRNFKIGRTSGGSLSGVSGGGAETLTLEDGYIFDCGNGSGQEHNAYISARTFTLRGVRMARTRGHSSTPPDVGNWDGSVTLEGHMLKASAVTGLIEGCSFDCVALADCSHLVQMKAGGNWTVRGNLFVDSKYPMTSRSMLNMVREYGGSFSSPSATTDGASYTTGDTVIGLASTGSGPIYAGWLIQFAGDTNIYKVAVGDADVSNGGTVTLAAPGLRQSMTGTQAITINNVPNFEWWAGIEGNSLTIERNVFVGRYPRAVVFFFDWSSGNTWSALYPPGDADATDDMKLSSLLVRDNIGMITGDTANHIQPGFPGTNNAKWITNDPTGGTYWDARNNTTETYVEPFTPFSNRELLIYDRAAGTIAATGGTLDTYRFVWPHGSMARSDAFRGLG